VTAEEGHFEMHRRRLDLSIPGKAARNKLSPLLSTTEIKLAGAADKCDDTAEGPMETERAALESERRIDRV
jgi:hypothetical protein